MRPHETDREEERLAGMLPDEFAGLRRGLAVRVNHVIAVGLHHDKRVAAHDRLLAVGIAFPASHRCPGGLPFRSLAVEALAP
jgi:hypothetical protein